MTNHIRNHWIKHKDKKWVTCKDGFTFSCLAGEHYKSSPDYDYECGDYQEWELGYPSQPDNIIMPYIWDINNPTRTIYEYVPTEVVNQLIEKHNGLED